MERKKKNQRFSWLARVQPFDQFSRFSYPQDHRTLPFSARARNSHEFPLLVPNNYATLSEQEISTCVFEHFSAVRALSAKGNGRHRINEERKRENSSAGKGTESKSLLNATPSLKMIPRFLRSMRINDPLQSAAHNGNCSLSHKLGRF